MEDRNQQSGRPTRRTQQNMDGQQAEQSTRRIQPEKEPEDIRQPAYLRGESKQSDPVIELPQNNDRLDEIYRVIDQLEDVIGSAKKVPLSKNIICLDLGIMRDLIGQLRMGFPSTLVEADNIMREKDRILSAAGQRAAEREKEADGYYDEKILKANQYDQETRTAADKYDRELHAFANQDANNILADAQTRADQIVQAAQRQQSEMIMDSEIVRRANAFALEIRDKAQRESDQIYSQACLQSDKMLSGAAAALSKAANDLAQLRDNLLNPNGQQNNYPTGVVG